MIYYSIYLLLANIFLKNCRGANFKGRGHVLSGRPLSRDIQSDCYIYNTLCAASAERRASSDIAVAADQSVSRWSTVNSSSCRRARSRARRWSIVALVNK